MVLCFLWFMHKFSVFQLVMKNMRLPDAPRRTKVSKIPFFDFSFTLLDLLRRNLAKAPAILERINRAGMAKLARGVEALCRLAVITSSRKYIVKTCKDI